MTFIDVASHLRQLRAQVPLVQCITNTVVQQFSANVLLAAGASPAMLDHEADAAQFARIADGLLVNLGTATDHQLLAADAATTAAAASGTPWVLDPVSYGAADHRSVHIRRLADSGPACIRGNASEIAALAGAGAGGRGVESTDEVDAVLGSAVHLAATTGAVVAISGPRDAVVAADPNDPARFLIARIGGGSHLMPLVIGTGCSLAALTAGYLGATTHQSAPDATTPPSHTDHVAAVVTAHAPFAAVVTAHAHFAAAGEQAAHHSQGPGSFAVAFIDALHEVSEAALTAIDVTVTTVERTSR